MKFFLSVIIAFSTIPAALALDPRDGFNPNYLAREIFNAAASSFGGVTGRAGQPLQCASVASSPAPSWGGETTGRKVIGAIPLLGRLVDPHPLFEMTCESPASGGHENAENYRVSCEVAQPSQARLRVGPCRLADEDLRRSNGNGLLVSTPIDIYPREGVPSASNQNPAIHNGTMRAKSGGDVPGASPSEMVIQHGGDGSTTSAND